MTGSGRYWFIAFATQYGVNKDAVALVLDGRPVIVAELEEALQDWPNMLIGEAKRLHHLQLLSSSISIVGNHGL